MSAERFMQLVEEYRGFEFIQAYRDDEDHFLGGKGNKYWYVIIKDGKTTDSYIGTYKDGEWRDVYIKGSGRTRKIKEMAAGSTIKRIAKDAYTIQKEDWVTRRTPKPIQDSHPHYHYVYGFGDKALDVSEKYGVSIGYSDLSDTAAGFRLRDLCTGDDVKLPE